MFQRARLFAVFAFTLGVLSLPQVNLGTNHGEAAAQQAQQPPRGVRQFGPRVVPPRGLPERRRQQAGPQPERREVAKHGDWAITCEKAPDSDQEACVMSQTAINPEGKQGGLTLIIANAKQQGEEKTVMRVIAPIGIFLPLGVALEIDGNPIARVPYTQCLPQVCVAIADARDDTITQMKRGSKAKFIIYRGPGQGINLDISLKGFTAAKRALDGL